MLDQFRVIIILGVLISDGDLTREYSNQINKQIKFNHIGRVIPSWR